MKKTAPKKIFARKYSPSDIYRNANETQLYQGT